MTVAADDEYEVWERYLGLQVRALDLSGSSAVADDTVNVVAMFCPNLQVLDLHGCRNVTYRSLCHLVRHHVPVAWINAEGTSVTRDSLAVILELLPGLTAFC
jgi:hypothetical protein